MTLVPAGTAVVIVAPQVRADPAAPCLILRAAPAIGAGLRGRTGVSAQSTVVVVVHQILASARTQTESGGSADTCSVAAGHALGTPVSAISTVIIILRGVGAYPIAAC